MTEINAILGTIKSNKGFYVGDITDVISEELIEEFFKDEEFVDDIYEDLDNDESFMVMTVSNGVYRDTDAREYSINSKNIGVIPLELMYDDADVENGVCFENTDIADISAVSGMLDIVFSNGETVHINFSAEKDHTEDYDSNYEEEPSYVIAEGFSYEEYDEVL